MSYLPFLWGVLLALAGAFLTQVRSFRGCHLSILHWLGGGLILAAASQLWWFFRLAGVQGGFLDLMPFLALILSGLTMLMAGWITGARRFTSFLFVVLLGFVFWASFANDLAIWRVAAQASWGLGIIGLLVRLVLDCPQASILLRLPLWVGLFLLGIFPPYPESESLLKDGFAHLTTISDVPSGEILAAFCHSIGVLLVAFGGWFAFRFGGNSLARDSWSVRRSVLFATAGLAILMLGWPVVYEVTLNTEREWREQLLQEVELASAGFGQAEFDGLNLALTDQALPNYWTLRHHLQLIAEAGSGYDSAYMMAMKSGKVIFVADSMVEELDLALPGEVYFEASPELIELFKTGGALVEGPLEDKWGVWVSGLAAIPGVRLEGSPVLLGVDRDASGWAAALGERRLALLLGIGLCFGLVMACYGTVEYVSSARQQQKDAAERLRLTLQGSQLGSWEYDGKNRQIYLDGSWNALIPSAPAGEWIELDKFLKLLDRRERDNASRRLSSLANSEITQFEDEWLFKGEEGQGIWLLVRGRLPDSQFGQVGRAQGMALDVSSRKRAQELERLQGAALESAANAIMITDQAGRIEWVNAAFEKLTGYLSSELKGKNPRLLKSGEHPKEYYHELWRTIRSGEVWKGHITNKRKDGSLYTEEAVITPLRDGRGEIAHFIAVKQDITEQIAREAELSAERSEKERLALAVENTTNAVVITDPEGCIEWVNAGFSRISGYLLEEVEGQRPGSFLQGEGSDPDAIQRIRTAVRAGEGFEEILLNYRKDGTPYWIQISAEVLKNEDGEHTGFMAIEQDVTDRVNSQQTIEAERGRLRTLLENMQEGVMVEDAARKVTFVNHSFEKMFGMRALEVVGQSCAGLVTTASRFFTEPARFTSSIDHAIASETAVKDQALETIDGRFFERDFVPIKESDRLIGYLWQYRDVTEETRFASRLVEAKDAAESANRAKSTFLATMSHEIRTPLNAVIGMTSLLLTTKLDEQQRDFASTVATSSESLLTLINDILDYSKIEAGRMDLEQTPFRLAELSIEALEIVIPSAQEKGVEVTYSVDPGLPAAVLGDQTRLRQVLLNLLSNAVKFTDSGTITLQVELGDQPGGILFKVQDTGIGIAPETQPRLFTPFTQADSSITRQYGGTGLGLAISGRLVELMGGKIQVASELGKGSTFSFAIPLAADDESPVDPKTDAPPELKGRSAIVVDNNDLNRSFVSRLLSTWGISARCYSDGESVLEAIAQGVTVDFLIIDIKMPGMDGIELARRITQESRGTHACLIGLGSVPQNLRVASKSDLFQAILPKPIRPWALMNLLVTHLDGESPTQRAPRIEQKARKSENRQSHLRVLLAEDNPTNQRVAVLLFKKLNVSVKLASNGQEALDEAREHDYDIIFMDVQMPVMDGLEATRRIRSWMAEQNPNSRLRIVAVTANAFREDREACLESGMDDYIPKPITLESLRRALADCSGAK